MPGRDIIITLSTAAVGRFVSVDPLYRKSPDRATSSPQRFSTYAYSLNNPQNRVDPDGYEDRPVNWAGVGASLYGMGSALLTIKEGAGITMFGAATPAAPVTTVAGGLLTGKGVLDLATATSGFIESVMGYEPTATSFFELIAVTGSAAAGLSPKQAAYVKLLATTGDSLLGSPKAPGVKSAIKSLGGDGALGNFSAQMTQNLGGFAKDLSTAPKPSRDVPAIRSQSNSPMQTAQKSMQIKK